MKPRTRIIDLSHELSPRTPPFPGDPALEVAVLDSTDTPSAAGERRVNLSAVRFGLHLGTHMDAPFHFFAGGESIDRVPLERCVGPALLVRLPCEMHTGTIERRHLEASERGIRDARRLVLDTGWHRRWGSAEYFEAHPVLNAGAARFLVECGVLLVGVDFPSVDRAPHDSHLELLGNGVLILENLTNLAALRSERFELVALPLKLLGRDGSPVRAIALEVVDS
jgi:kynurenine formamidase